MYVVMISRATLFSMPGGDSTQITKTAEYLRNRGVTIDIKLTSDIIDYSKYDLIHFFNIIRPSDILGHIKKSKLPYVVSPIYVEFDNVEKLNSGIRKLLYKIFGSDGIEYIKTVARIFKNGEQISDWRYLALGHRNSLKYVIKNSQLLLPNSHSEMKRLANKYRITKKYIVVPNAIDKQVFDLSINANPNYLDAVITVGQITPRKNQLNIIRALNRTSFDVFIIGKPSRNALDYYKQCKKEASSNIHFIDYLEHEELAKIYKAAKVHILASWFETTGLVSIEAAIMGCNIVITDEGDQKEYFKEYATYCKAGSVSSIREAVEIAYKKEYDTSIKDYIFSNYTWDITANKTLEAYKKVIECN